MKKMKEHNAKQRTARTSPVGPATSQTKPKAPFANIIPGDESEPSRRSELALVVLLILLAGMPYLNSLRNGFVYDDPMQVLANPYIRDFHHLPEIFTQSVWAFKGSDNSNYYRPVMFVGYLLLLQLFGPQAWAFHLTNILLHVAVVFVLFQVTKKLFQNWRLAALAAGAFAIHPIHSEAVDWIAGVTDLELTLFYLLAFLFFLDLGAANHIRVRDWIPRQIAMAVCFALALLSKEPAATLPVVATLFEHFYREDRRQTALSEKVSRYGILWLLVGMYFALRIHFLGAALASRVNLDLKFSQVLVAAIALIGQYTGKLLWPVRLCAYYLFLSDWSSLRTWTLIGGLVLLASGVFIRFQWKRDRLPIFALVWFFATIAPVLNPRWLAANVFTERYAYLPSVGFCWLVGWGLVAAWSSSALRSVPLQKCLAGVIATVAILAVCEIVARNHDWHDDLTLYSQTLVRQPNAYWIRNNLGKVFWDKGDITAAEREWRAALRVAPGAELILGNLGMLDTTVKRYHDAVAYLEPAARLDPGDEGVHRNLGTCYQELRLWAKAEKQLQTVVQLAPNDAKSMDRLSEVYYAEGRFAEAREQATQSLSAEPSGMGYVDLGLAEWRLGRLSEAEKALRSAEHFDPQTGLPHFLLALFYEKAGKIAVADEEIGAFVKIDPDNDKAKAAFTAIQARTQKSP